MVRKTLLGIFCATVVLPVATAGAVAPLAAPVAAGGTAVIVIGGVAITAEQLAGATAFAAAGTCLISEVRDGGCSRAISVTAGNVVSTGRQLWSTGRSAGRELWDKGAVAMAGLAGQLWDPAASAKGLDRWWGNEEAARGAVERLKDAQSTGQLNLPVEDLPAQPWVPPLSGELPVGPELEPL